MQDTVVNWLVHSIMKLYSCLNWSHLFVVIEWTSLFRMADIWSHTYFQGQLKKHFWLYLLLVSTCEIGTYLPAVHHFALTPQFWNELVRQKVPRNTYGCVCISLGPISQNGSVLSNIPFCLWQNLWVSRGDILQVPLFKKVSDMKPSLCVGFFF